MSVKVRVDCVCVWGGGGAAKVTTAFRGIRSILKDMSDLKGIVRIEVVERGSSVSEPQV